MNKKLKIYKIKNEYGVDPRELCDIKEAREMIERVSIYHNLKGKDHMIDSITWNDLEMDEVFHLVNHTRSYAGEQVLYHILHGSETEKRDRIDKEADYFAQNEDERINMELGLMNIGKGSLNYYIPDVIDGFGKILVKEDCRKIRHNLLFFYKIQAALICFFVRKRYRHFQRRKMFCVRLYVCTFGVVDGDKRNRFFLQ